MRTAGLVVILLALGCDSGDPDFALVAPDDPIVLVRGQTGEIDVGLDRMGDFDGTVVVTAGGLRAGITPGTVVIAAGQHSGILTLAVEGSAEEGPVDGAHLVGIGGELERMVPITITVTAP